MSRGDLRSARAAQIAWLLTALLVSPIWIAAPASSWGELLTVCHPDSACRQFQLDVEAVHTLSRYGISLHAYAAFTAVVLVALWVIWYGMSALIIWRKPDDRGALLAAFFLTLFPIWETVQWYPPGPLHSLAVAFIAMLFLFALLFPDGRFAPRWTRWVAAAMLGIFAMAALPLPGTASDALNAIAGIFVVGLFPCVIGVQIYRYRSRSSWTERQQTKWAVFGLMVAIVGLAASWFGSSLASFPTGNGSLYYSFTNVDGTGMVMTAIPISIGIAVLRGRLWDIDHLINRALVYASLTLTLGALYVGSVLLLQTLFGLVAGKPSTPAIALSTLVIVILFNPLRHRIQDVIARAFYRRRYDAAKVLSAYGAACRDQTDLEQLRAGLVGVVEETMQPGHVSLWLAGSSRSGSS